MRRPSIHSDGGFSLVEILVTIVIVGITFTAILGGIITSITASAYQRNEATTDALARSAGEWVKDSKKNPYNAICPSANPYSLSGLTVPSGFSVQITEVAYWTGNQLPAVSAPYVPEFNTSCPSTDHGMQRINIEAKSADGQATETVQVIKRTVP